MEKETIKEESNVDKEMEQEVTDSVQMLILSDQGASEFKV